MTNADATWRSELPCAEGTASLVLGAGNQSFLTFIAALDRSFVHGEAVLIKHHPLRPWLFAPYAKLLEPLERRGLVAQTLDGGRSAQLVLDPRVGHVYAAAPARSHRALSGELRLDRRAPPPLLAARSPAPKRAPPQSVRPSTAPAATASG